MKPTNTEIEAHHSNHIRFLIETALPFCAQSVAHLLIQHFAATVASANELPNQPPLLWIRSLRSRLARDAEDPRVVFIDLAAFVAT